MGPKKGKDITDDENYWRICIEEAPLNDETWNIKVILLEAAGSDQDRIYLNKFESYAAEERRFVIKNICKTETIFMINQLGGEKKVKDDNLRVFEEGQSYLKEKKDVPADIMALIIKHLILKMKEEYLFINRQRLEVQEGMKRESMTMVNKTEVRGTVNVKPPEPQQAVPTSKGVSLSPSETDENKKYNTLLRVRGEEWRDKVYIDDYPIDGPNLYIAISGFLEPYLAGSLIKIGIPLTAVVQIRINLMATTIPSSLLRATKRGQSQTEILTEKSLKFWEDTQQLRIKIDSSDDFKNTAFIIFSPPYWNTEALSGSPENIYDELCYLMYDIQDLTRQHAHYLDNMDIITIPEESKDDYYQSLYDKQIDCIPLESMTVYFILDILLQAVCMTQEVGDSNKSSESEAQNLDQSNELTKEEDRLQTSEKLVKDLIGAFCKLDSQKKLYRVTNGEEYENHKNPIIINYGDFCKYSIFHLDNVNLDPIVWTMLIGMPITKLWYNKDKLTEDIQAKINFHVNALLSCFERNDVETSELTRLIQILACRKLYNNRSSLKKDHLQPTTVVEFKKTFLKRSILAEPLPKCSVYKCASSTSHSSYSGLKNKESEKTIIDENNEDLRIKFIFDCPDISELVSAAEIAIQKPIDHLIDDFEFFEDFVGINALQIMDDAFKKFNCIDYKYCEVTDSFIMMFYNSHDKDGIAREEWRYHLSTPVCLQDFFDFVLEEHYDWIKDEEKKYDESTALKSQSECKDTKDPMTANSCLENTDVELELLMEGSLKYYEFTNVEDVDPELSNSKLFSTKKTTSAVSTTDADSMKSSKKAKFPAASTPKFAAPEPDVDGKLEPIKKTFSGYDLGDRRVEVFGKDSMYFSKDGSRVYSNYYLIIPMNFEFVTLSVFPGNDYNEFWMHKVLGEVVNPEIVNTCESFRIKTKDQLLIYVKKQVYQTALPLINPFSRNTLFNASTVKSSIGFRNDVVTEILTEPKSFHSLYITWPNGLITESVYEDNSSIFSHIKQHYITPLSNIDEDMRCISLNGEVIIFKSNGEIDIFIPDSSCFKITKCEKRIINEEIPEDVASATSSDKSKKAKGKDKPHKTSSKSSKTALIDDEKENLKVPEYELFIDEFEVIESNGLRQKWINGNKFDIEKLLIKTATDFCLREIFSKRMDGTNILFNKDGVQVVTFPDNTRIITTYVVEDDEIFPEWTEEEIEYLAMCNNDLNISNSKNSLSQENYGSHNKNSNRPNSLESVKSEFLNNNNKEERNDGYISINIIYSIEHPYFTTVTINKFNGKISIESPNNTSVTFDRDNNYTFLLDKQTSAKFNGENLNINYEACTDCKSYTTCEVKIKSEEISSVTQLQRNWLKMTDSFYKKISVNEEGNIDMIQDLNSETSQSLHSESLEEHPNYEEIGENDIIPEATIRVHETCKEMYEAKSLKFFILKRDLTCSQLLHRSIVEHYKQVCYNKKWCTINQYDTFKDHRSLWSILTPIRLKVSEKWIMESKLSEKPQYLTYKDLAKDSGKGFYHWMRPYKRFKPKPIKPNRVISEKLPRAFILRTLEQQWKDSHREKLKGAKELLNAIFRYRDLMGADSQTILNVPIQDKRPERERKTDKMIQALAHRVYEDIRVRLADDMQTRVKQTITAKPPQPPEAISVEGEDEEEYSDELRVLKDQADAVKAAESADPTSPNLKRYWRRRAEEYKEEQFYKYLLREGSVPPYFRNVLGGAIWWDMSKAADDAVANAERRKMKCVCDEKLRESIKVIAHIYHNDFLLR